MKRFGLAVLAVAALAVTARPAMSQAAAGSLRYGIFGGLVMPMGDYGDLDKMGFVGGAGATYWLASGNIGIRGEASYAQTSHDGVDGNTKMIGGLASVVYALQPASAPARFMLSGGLGFTNVKESITDASESKLSFGFGAAVAFKLGAGSTRLVVGTRYQSVTTDPSLNFVPITVGLSFGK
jgi:hypothetical protein